MELRPAYPVETRRLRLRPPTAGDIADVLRYRGRADVCRYLPFEPMDADELRRRLDGAWGNTELTAGTGSLTLLAERRDDGRVAGEVILFLRSVTDLAGELGYVFHPEVARTGLATEACRAVLGLAFDPRHGLGLHRLTALMDARNTASARMAARLGMRHEAHHVQAAWFKGGWADTDLYAILEAEWRAGPTGTTPPS